MITLFRKRPARGGECTQCRIIRSFMAAAFMLVVLALVAADRMHYIKGITTDHIAAAMMAGGVLLFIVKFVLWQREKKSQRSADEQFSSDE